MHAPASPHPFLHRDLWGQSLWSPHVPLRLFTLEVTGPSFLYKMVRNIAGAVVETGLGRGRLSPGDIAAALAAGRQCRAGLAWQTAPAHGLTLHSVHYPANPAWVGLVGGGRASRGSSSAGVDV